MHNEFQDNFSKRRKIFLSLKSNSSLKTILSYLWDYKWLFSFVVIMGLIQSVLFLVSPMLLGPILDILVDPSSLIENVYPIFILIIGLQAIVALLFGIRVYINRWIGANVIYKLRNDLFLTIQIMSFSWLDLNKTGELLSRTTSDVNLLKEFLGNNLQLFIRQLFTFILSFAILFLINFELAIYVVLVSPALFYVLFMFRKKMRPIFKKSRETYAELTHKIQENVQGIKIVKAFTREDHEIKEFAKSNKKYYEDSMKIIRLQVIFDPLIYLIDSFAFLIVLLLGSYFVYEGKITFGEIFSFILVMNFSVEPLYFISRFLGNMPQISETCDRVVHVLKSEIDIKEDDNAKNMPIIKGEVIFENIYFKYSSEGKHNVLEDINFKVKSGETIAILGSTGSGKSTLVKLIPRFYNVSQGRILIDGVNIQDVKFKSLRKQIGYVSQERILFSRSIKENICLGNRNLSDVEIENYAKIADIHDFITSDLKEKYETKVGERGLTLSGGQKQRIAIARAIAVKPKILILDDCFSSVDVDTEYKIQKSLKKVIKNTTTFLITQRLSTVRHADRILVLDKGKIVQLGSHEELIKDDEGIYRKLYLTLKVEERSK
ncbi:MAG: ABC transporter ATP-binding protein [Candidatus Lokiarchaeota archaeon]|nr:ABC transporter ATP-binding protein [Candidatus Lokiarchaeota archaeon]